jgi:prepilin-type N-terminal cleavage/methylation domain
MPRPVHSRQGRFFPRAFTLIELLTVIAIIGILAAIILATLGQVRRSADRAGCASNLRQIGFAVQLYVQDNKGRLPGPCYNAQGASGGGQLFPFLTPYVGAGPEGKAPPVFDCPAWTKATNGAAGLNRFFYLPALKLANSTIIQPFGYPAGEKGENPHLLREIPDPSRNRAIVDFDQGVSNSAATVASPVHGSGRNVLFFDGHVSFVRLSEWK